MRKESNAEHILLDYPLLRLGEACNDLFAHTRPPATGPNLRFDDTRTAQAITFLHQTGLGFSQDIHDRFLKDGPEADDLGVGPVGGLSLDLDL